MKLSEALPALAALAHEGRLTLFRLLVRAGDDGMAAGDIARAATINVTTSSARLKVLAQAGLIGHQRQGRSILYRVDFARISQLLAFLMEDCCAGRAEILDRLDGVRAKCE